MPHPEEGLLPADVLAGGHLDEGTVHAWLDGALSADESALVSAHAAGCPACAALVAEARGLLAGASRILGALDAVPGGVIPARPEVAAPVSSRRTVRRAAWWTGVPARAAAAVLLVAGASSLVLRRGSDPSASAAYADSAAPAASPPAARAKAAPQREASGGAPVTESMLAARSSAPSAAAPGTTVAAPTAPQLPPAVERADAERSPFVAQQPARPMTLTRSDVRDAPAEQSVATDRRARSGPARLPVAGCYRVSGLPGAVAPSPPARLVLDTTAATDADGRLAWTSRLAGVAGVAGSDGARGAWALLGADSVRIVWPSDRAISLRVRVETDAGRVVGLRGIAKRAGTVVPVTAARTDCDPPR